MSRRILISVMIGLASGLLCWKFLTKFEQGAADFQWATRAARALIARTSPYDIPQQQYPPPAALFGLPFVGLRGEVAGALFFGLSSGLLAFGLTRQGWERLLIFLAFPYWAALITAQWSPLILASAFFWWLWPVALVKPQIALPVVLTNWNWRGVLLSALLFIVSIALTPMWYRDWFHQLGQYHFFVPLLIVPGFLLLLVLLRRNDKDARLLLLASVMPQRWFYDVFVLWLIPKARREIVMTVGASWVVGLWRWYHFPANPAQVGQWTVLGMYLPMMIVILLRDPRIRRNLPGWARSESCGSNPTPEAT